MATRKLAAVRGMNDMLPADAPLWEWFEARVTDWLRSYGYQQIRTPIVEYTELFVKGIGEVANVGTAAAIANAVYHATGRRVRELPIRIEKLLG